MIEVTRDDFEPVNSQRQRATAAQLRVYRLVVQGWQRLRPFSYQEMCERLGINSVSAIEGHVRALQRKGWIRHAYYEKRAIVPRGSDE